MRPLLEQARSHLEAGDHGAAIASFEQALAEREQVPTLLALAQLHAVQGQWDAAERRLARAEQLSPQSAYVQLGLAEVSLARGKLDEARSRYGTVASGLPMEPTPRLVLGALADTRQDAETALHGLTVWRKRAPAGPEMRELAVAEATLRSTLGETADREATWQRARALTVGNVERAIRMARIYLRLRNWTAARVLLEGAAEARPASRLTWKLLAAAALEDGDFAAAREAMGRADALPRPDPSAAPEAEDLVLGARIDIGSGRAKAAHDLLSAALTSHADAYSIAERARLHYWLGRSLMRLDRPEEARKQLEAVAGDSPARVAAELELARLEVAAGQSEAARARLQRAAAGAAPPALHLLLARLEAEAGRTAEVEQALQRGLEQHAAETSLWLALAQHFAHAGNAARAKGALDQTLRLSPSHAQALGLKAQLTAATDPQAAIAVYRTLLDKEPGHVAASNNLALLLARSAEHRDEALALATAAHEARPDDARIIDTLGWVHHLRGEHALALPLLERALSASADSGQIQYHLGAVLITTGAQKRGEELVRSALARSDLEDAAEARALLGPAKDR